MYVSDKDVNLDNLGDDFWGSVKQINGFTLFANAYYQSLDDSDPMKDFLNYYMGASYYSEEFIWNQRGLLPVGYKKALLVIRGDKNFNSNEGGDGSTWTYESNTGLEFPVLNSTAADAVIAMVMKNMKSDSCAIGFGQWQQSYVSKTILSMPWALPVNTDQNLVVFKDHYNKFNTNINPNRHKFVLGPITWLSMALDIRNWDKGKNQNINYKDTIELGKKKWSIIQSHIKVNQKLCEIAKSKTNSDGPYPDEINSLFNNYSVDGQNAFLCNIPARPNPKTKKYINTKRWNATINIVSKNNLGLCTPNGWGYMDYEQGDKAWNQSIAYLDNYTNNYNYNYMRDAALSVERFYFRDNLEKTPFPFPKVIAVKNPKY